MPRLSKIGAAALAAFGWTGLQSVTASYLVVAGGGAGGFNGNGGGGGAGGFLTGTTSLNPTLSYTVTVGGGGTSVAAVSSTNGSNSTFNAITATGGGAGGPTASGVGAGNSGGSGGGGLNDSTNYAGGSGTSGQGNAGGASGGGGAPYPGGGGGGASAAGTIGTSGGQGGNGSTASAALGGGTYAGGGGGARSSGSASVGGSGGGGNGGVASVGVAGTANLGGGGGGSGSGAGAQGGSGVVIISYSAPQQFGGGVVTTSGSNVIHTFNTSGTLSPLSSLTASYLIVAGGGAGGVGYGGGGGAGGMLTGSGVTIDTNSNYVVTVGAGGAAGIGGSGVITTYPSNGSNSVLSIVSTTAVGGGRGGSSGTAASNGGSGGGASPGNLTTGTNGTGTAGQGNNGGTAQAGAVNYGAGGGGGAGGAGGNGTNTVAGNGGIGSASSISGSSVTYAAGGGAGTYSAGTVGTGGSGIGGSGNLTGTATSGSTNTGSGGGGSTQTTPGFNYDSGAGGSGIVIISYAGATQQMAGGTVTITGGNVIHTFTSSGYLTPIKYVNNSLRFRKSASAYLNRNPASNGTRTTWTYSTWVKRGQLGAGSIIHAQDSGNTVSTEFNFASDDTIYFREYGGSGYTGYLQTTQVFRDPSAWYHLVLVWDSNNGTSGDRIRLYVNGTRITSFSTATYPSSGITTVWNSTNLNRIGFPSTSTMDGYLTEINFVDGQALTPNSFGTFNSYGVWQPITYGGSYGTNGFYLPFTNKTSTTTLGYDFSPNGNNWTTNNISLTAGSTYDSMTDVPTLTSATAANWCVLNPLEKYSGLTIADGNLKVTASDNTSYGAAGTLAISSGKWYYEAIFSVASVNNQAMGLVTTNNNVQTAQWAGSTGMFMCGNFVSGTAIHVGVNGSYTQVSTTLPSAGSYLVCAVDYDNGKAWFGTTTSSGGAVTWYPASTGGTVGNPAAGTNPTITFSTTYPIRPFMGSYGSGANWIANFGQQPFVTTQPSGFLGWNTYNL